MKTRLLSFLCLMIITQNFAQESDLKVQRDQLYQDYINFKDTITSRTWLNMVNLSKKLEAVVFFDNMMLDSLAITSPSQADLQARLVELSKIKDELIISNARVNVEYSRSEKARKGLFIAAIISGILILGLIIALVILSIKHRKVVSEVQNHSAHTLKLKEQHKIETDALKDQVENCTGEIELLENNALEMKKSFDVMKSEHVNHSNNSESTSSEEIEEIRREVAEMSDELSRVMEERDEFEEALGMANLKIAHQMDLNKKFEADLESLLVRIKSKPKNDQD